MKNDNTKLKIIFTLLIFGAVFLLPKISLAATYYVSPTGSTVWPNCTSQDSPCLADSTTTGKAFLGASAGDTVYFLPGTYNPGNAPSWEVPAWNPSYSGSSGNPITFKCTTQEGCILTTNTVGPAAGAVGKDYITWDGFKTTTKVSKQPVFRFVTSDHYILRNCSLTGFIGAVDPPGDNNPIVTAGGTNGLIQNCEFKDNKDTVGTHNSAGLLMYSAHALTIEKSTFTNCYTGIYEKNDGQGNTYRFNFFYNNIMSFFTQQAAGGPGTTNRYIYQNVIVDTVNQALDTVSQQDVDYTSTNIQFYNNTIYKPLGTSGHFTYVMQQITNSHFWNNIVWGVGFTYYNAYSNDGKPTYMDYNIYNGAQKFYAGGTTKSSLADWKVSGLLLGGGNPDANSSYGDPQFVNAGGATVTDYKRTSYPTNGRGGGYASVIGAYITGNETIGYTPSISPDTTPPAAPSGVQIM